LEKARQDKRIHYHCFAAEDSKDERLDAVWQAQMEASYRAGRQPIQAPSPPWSLTAWSLGLKRNVACHLSRGAIIAHFDDDDLYSANYLEHMYSELQASVETKRGRQQAEELKGGTVAAIATLSEWHMVDMVDASFRWMDPKTEVMPEHWRKPMIDGYGFSYMFSRAAWQMQAFPDKETSEDDIFMQELRKKGAVVTTVPPTASDENYLTGFVAHTFHSDCTSGGEWNGQKRCGKVVKMPQQFEARLPIFHSVARQMPKRGASGPPVEIVPAAAPFDRRGVFGGKGGGKGKGRTAPPREMWPKFKK